MSANGCLPPCHKLPTRPGWRPTLVRLHPLTMHFDLHVSGSASNLRPARSHSLLLGSVHGGTTDSRPEFCLRCVAALQWPTAISAAFTSSGSGLALDTTDSVQILFGFYR